MYKKVNAKAKFVAIDADGRKFEYEYKPTRGERVWLAARGVCCFVSSNNDATNWQNSLIEIDAQEYKHELKNPWANYFAVDKDGEGFEFEKEPRLLPVCWYGYGKWAPVDHNYQGDWKESLQKRGRSDDLVEGESYLLTNDKGYGVEYAEHLIDKEVKLNHTFINSNDVSLAVIENFDRDCYVFRADMLKPIKTEREKIIEKATQVVVYDECEVFTSRALVIESLYNAGMLKLPFDQKDI